MSRYNRAVVVSWQLVQIGACSLMACCFPHVEVTGYNAPPNDCLCLAQQTLGQEVLRRPFFRGWPCSRPLDLTVCSVWFVPARSRVKP